MPSTKRFFTVLALGSVLSLCGTLAAEKKGQEKENNHENHGSQVSTFPGTIGMMNPCPEATPGLFFVNGTNVARYHENKNFGFIRVRFLAKGLDAAQQPVTAYLYAKAKVDAGSSMYDIPFESIWVDKGTHNFEFSANLQVTVLGGRITSANIVLNPNLVPNGYTLQCTDDTNPVAAEHRYNHDKDHDRDDDDKD